MLCCSTVGMPSSHRREVGVAKLAFTAFLFTLLIHGSFALTLTGSDVTGTKSTGTGCDHAGVDVVFQDPSNLVIDSGCSFGTLTFSGTSAGSIVINSPTISTGLAFSSLTHGGSFQANAGSIPHVTFTSVAFQESSSVTFTSVALAVPNSESNGVLFAGCTVNGGSVLFDTVTQTITGGSLTAAFALVHIDGATTFAGTNFLLVLRDGSYTAACSSTLNLISFATSVTAVSHLYVSVERPTITYASSGNLRLFDLPRELSNTVLSVTGSTIDSSAVAGSHYVFSSTTLWTNVTAQFTSINVNFVGTVSTKNGFGEHTKSLINSQVLFSHCTVDLGTTMAGFVFTLNNLAETVTGSRIEAHDSTFTAVSVTNSHDSQMNFVLIAAFTVSHTAVDVVNTTWTATARFQAMGIRFGPSFANGATIESVSVRIIDSSFVLTRVSTYNNDGSYLIGVECTIQKGLGLEIVGSTLRALITNGVHPWTVSGRFLVYGGGQVTGFNTTVVDSIIDVVNPFMAIHIWLDWGRLLSRDCANCILDFDHVQFVATSYQNFAKIEALTFKDSTIRFKNIIDAGTTAPLAAPIAPWHYNVFMFFRASGWVRTSIIVDGMERATNTFDPVLHALFFSFEHHTAQDFEIHVADTISKRNTGNSYSDLISFEPSAVVVAYQNVHIGLRNVTTEVTATNAGRNDVVILGPAGTTASNMTIEFEEHNMVSPNIKYEARLVLVRLPALNDFHVIVRNSTMAITQDSGSLNLFGSTFAQASFTSSSIVVEDTTITAQTRIGDIELVNFEPRSPIASSEIAFRRCTVSLTGTADTVGVTAMRLYSSLANVRWSVTSSMIEFSGDFALTSNLAAESAVLYAKGVDLQNSHVVVGNGEFNMDTTCVIALHFDGSNFVTNFVHSGSSVALKNLVLNAAAPTQAVDRQALSLQRTTVQDASVAIANSTLNLVGPPSNAVFVRSLLLFAVEVVRSTVKLEDSSSILTGMVSYTNQILLLESTMTDSTVSTKNYTVDMTASPTYANYMDAFELLVVTCTRTQIILENTSFVANLASGGATFLGMRRITMQDNSAILLKDVQSDMTVGLEGFFVLLWETFSFSQSKLNLDRILLTTTAGLGSIVVDVRCPVLTASNGEIAISNSTITQHVGNFALMVRVINAVDFTNFDLLATDLVVHDTTTTGAGDITLMDLQGVATSNVKAGSRLAIVNSSHTAVSTLAYRAMDLLDVNFIGSTASIEGSTLISSGATHETTALRFGRGYADSSSTVSMSSTTVDFEDGWPALVFFDDASASVSGAVALSDVNSSKPVGGVRVRNGASLSSASLNFTNTHLQSTFLISAETATLSGLVVGIDGADVSCNGTSSLFPGSTVTAAAEVEIGIRNSVFASCATSNTSLTDASAVTSFCAVWDLVPNYVHELASIVGGNCFVPTPAPPPTTLAPATPTPPTTEAPVTTPTPNPPAVTTEAPATTADASVTTVGVTPVPGVPGSNGVTSSTPQDTSPVDPQTQDGTTSAASTNPQQNTPGGTPAPPQPSTSSDASAQTPQSGATTSAPSVGDSTNASTPEPGSNNGDGGGAGTATDAPAKLPDDGGAGRVSIEVKESGNDDDMEIPIIIICVAVVLILLVLLALLYRRHRQRKLRERQQEEAADIELASPTVMSGTELKSPTDPNALSTKVFSEASAGDIDLQDLEVPEGELGKSVNPLDTPSTATDSKENTSSGGESGSEAIVVRNSPSEDEIPSGAPIEISTESVEPFEKIVAAAASGSLSTAGTTSTKSSSGQSSNRSGSRRKAARELIGESAPIKFLKGDLIGAGGFGRVYQGVDESTGALLAAKEVTFQDDSGEWSRQVTLLKREIAVMKELNHPNVIRYFGGEKIGLSFFIYMEHVAGGSISSLLKKHGAFSMGMARDYIVQMLDALCYMHSMRVVHRDVKGANTLVAADGTVKIIDFGASRHMSTATGIGGTPCWMAPEILRGEAPTPAGDIWALGCTAMEMLTGRVPWSHINNGSIAATMYHVASGNHELPDLRNPVAADFVSQCLTDDATKRPSAETLLKHPFCDLNTELEDSGPPPKPESPTTGEDEDGDEDDAARNSRVILNSSRGDTTVGVSMVVVGEQATIDAHGPK